MPILKLNNQGKMSSGFWISSTAYLTTRHSMPNTDTKVRCSVMANQLTISDDPDGFAASVQLHPEKDIALLIFDKPVVAEYLPLGHLQVEDGADLRLNIRGYPMAQRDIVKRHVDNVTTAKTDEDIVVAYELINQGISAGFSGSPVLLTEGEKEYAVGTLQRGGEDSFKSMASSFWTIREWLQERALVMFTRLKRVKQVNTPSASNVQRAAIKNTFKGTVAKVQIGDIYNNYGKSEDGDE